MALVLALVGELQDRADPERSGRGRRAARDPTGAGAGRARRAARTGRGRGRRTGDVAASNAVIGLLERGDWTNAGAEGPPAATWDVFPRPGREANLEAGKPRDKAIHRKRIEGSRRSHAAAADVHSKTRAGTTVESPCSGPTTQSKARRAVVAGCSAALAVAARRGLRGRQPRGRRATTAAAQAGRTATRGGGDGSPRRRRRAAERAIGGGARRPRRARREARLRVFGEAAATGTACRAARCRRARRCGSCSTSSDAGRRARTARASRPSRCRGDGAPPAPVALDRRAAFLLNTRTGDLVLPAGATRPRGAHAARRRPGDAGPGARRAQPGRRLRLGGEAAAAARDRPSPRRRALPRRALSRGGRGRARRPAAPRPCRRRATSAAASARSPSPAAGGRLWAVDEEAGAAAGHRPVTRGGGADRRRARAGRRSPSTRGDGRGAGGDRPRGRRSSTCGPAASLDARALPGAAGGGRRRAGARAPTWSPTPTAALSCCPRGASGLRRAAYVRVGGARRRHRAPSGVAPDGRTAVVLNEGAGEHGARRRAPSAGVLRRVEARRRATCASRRTSRSPARPPAPRSRGSTSHAHALERPRPRRPGAGSAPGLEAGEALVPSPAARKCLPRARHARAADGHGRDRQHHRRRRRRGRLRRLQRDGRRRARAADRARAARPLPARAAPGRRRDVPLPAPRGGARGRDARAGPRRERARGDASARRSTVRFDVRGAAPERGARARLRRPRRNAAPGPGARPPRAARAATRRRCASPSPAASGSSCCPRRPGCSPGRARRRSCECVRVAVEGRHRAKFRCDV